MKQPSQFHNEFSFLKQLASSFFRSKVDVRHMTHVMGIIYVELQTKQFLSKIDYYRLLIEFSQSYIYIIYIYTLFNSHKLFWLKLPLFLFKLDDSLQYLRGPPRGRGPLVEDHCPRYMISCVRFWIIVSLLLVRYSILGIWKRMCLMKINIWLKYFLLQAKRL